MKKLLLAIIIFISGYAASYATCSLIVVEINGGVSPMNICEGTSLTLSGQVTVGSTALNGGYSYSWMKDNTVLSTGTIMPVTGMPTAVPSYTGITGLSSDAGDYILRIEDGNAGNSTCYKEAIIHIIVNPKPTITGNLNICPNSTSQLTGSETAAATNAWTSATTTVAVVSGTGLVTPVASGTSDITYTTSTGCKQKVTVKIYASPTISGTLMVCEGATTQLTGSGVAAATDAWISASPTVATVDNSGLVTGLSPGISVITYTNSDGCKQTATVTVTNTTLIPSVSITTNQGSTICDGTSVTFKAIGIYGGTPTYEWTSSINGGILATGDTYTSSNLVDGEVISVKMNSTLNCASSISASNSISMHVWSAGIVPSVSVTSDKTSICAGSSVTFYATATNVILRPSYEWFIESNGNQISQGASSLTDYLVTSNLQSNDKVFVKITSNDACANHAPISSSSLTTFVYSPISAGIISSQTICAGTIPNPIKELTTSNTLSPTYEWISSNGANVPTWTTVAGANSPDLILSDIYNFNGYFRRIVTDANVPAPCNVAYTDIATIQVVPCTSFSSNITGASQITSGQQNVTYSVPAQTGFTYAWTITGGTITSGQNTNSVTVDWDNIASSPMVRTTSVSYSISVTETNQANQSKTTNLDITTTTTGTTQTQAQAGIKLFPNPTTGSFRIEMPETGMDVDYEILDVTGVSVASGSFTSTGSDQLIDANFGAGMYQVILKYNNVVTCARLSKVQ